MTVSRSDFIALIEQGSIPTENISAALLVTNITPQGASWRNFFDHLLILLAGLALSFSALFFIAYNWGEMGRFMKFALAQGFIVLAVGAYCKFEIDSSASKVSLLTAVIGMGVFLALIGQTYQTGADPWQLFFYWAILILPWVFVGRSAVLWIIWVVLIEGSMYLYFQGGSHWSTFTLVFAVVNGAILAAWERLARTRPWLSPRWAARLLATSSGIAVTLLLVQSIFRDSQAMAPALTWLLWLLWVGVMHFVYRRKIPDLFMMAGVCLSVMVIFASLTGRHIVNVSSIASLLVFAVLITGLSAGAAMWLKHIQKEFQA